MEPILIVGGGAVGSFLAAHLAQSREAVVLLCRGDRLETIRREGLLLQGSGKPLQIAVEARRSCDGLGKARLVIICTKAGDVRGALAVVEGSVGPQTAFLTLQNGVEAPLTVARRFPNAAIIASRVHGFFEMAGNKVKHVGVEPSVVFGHAYGPDLGAVEFISELLRNAGIAGHPSPNIAIELWSKFVLASAFGGVGAATGMAAGLLRKDARGWALLEAAISEVYDLGLKSGISLPPDCPERTLAFVASFPDEATTSMKRDLEARRPSEYASLTGAVIRMAAEIGLKVPTFNRLEAMIRERGLLL